ncbi:MAG: UDP-2,4-diacetamido-2,4,6-trideoxy-beta-L-altropyranose hydrolase [Lachnospiraceae bacterium]|nr:UDP-2,4-diacetamido-2,4,6-trideoxy-beta-L-altropyranose hydrolase [Lachnospiraceae bacterium]
MEGKQSTMIFIRTDGNEILGMGHLMRCMSIARALEERNVRCLFLVAQQPAGDFIKEKGFACEVLNTDFRDMEKEIPLLEILAEKYMPKCWLVDSYQVTGEYLSKLRKMAPAFYMEDTGENIFKADGLINYNIYGQDLKYEERCPSGMRLLLGVDYAPVKREFLTAEYQIRDEVRNILITMGGSDKLNIAGNLCRHLIEDLSEEVSLTVIGGRFNGRINELMKLHRKHPRIKVLVDVPDMWNRMQEADIAVSAAGSTMYELSAMGVPTVCCYYADNQRRMAEACASRLELINAGDYRKDPDGVLKIMSDEICQLVNSKEKREKLSIRMKQVVDGKGVERIAQELCNI